MTEIREQVLEKSWEMYQSGAHTMAEIAEHFGLERTTLRDSIESWVRQKTEKEKASSAATENA
jgi:transposase-like protein